MEMGSQEQGRYAEGSSADTGELKEKATQLTHTARQRAMSTIDQQKDQIGSLLDRLAQSAEGDRFGGYAADFARRGADYLRRHSAEELFDNLRSGIRARPGLLLGACFVGGLAIARVMKGGDSGGGYQTRSNGRWDAEGRSAYEGRPAYWDEEVP